MTLTRRLWLSLTVPVAVVLAVYGWFAHQNRHRVLMDEAYAEIRNHAMLVETALETSLERGDLDLLERKINRLARADRVLGVAVFDAKAHPVRATEGLDAHAVMLADLARRAIGRDEAVEEELSIDNVPALLRTVTFSHDHVAVVVRDLKYLPLIARVLDRGLVVMGFGMLALIAGIVAWAARSTVGRPAGAMVAGARRVAAGDLTCKVPETGARELLELAQAFNRMTSSLAVAREDVGRQQAERLATERKLRQIQALAAAGQVAASIGHEIGSPLNVILGRARRAMEQADCSDATRNELEIIARQSERISGFVGRLLDVVRSPPAISSEPADLVAVGEEVLAFLGPDCRRRGVECSMDTPDRPVRTALARDLVFQIVFNLCLNAAQAQPTGGALVIRVRSAEGARAALLEVEDEGPGVDPEVTQRIFEPFFTTKSEQGGTGLGLAIVSGIVRDAAGTVEVIAGHARGACFRVTLPAPVIMDRCGPGDAEVHG